MIRSIEPRGPVTALLSLPGSKSLTARALVCAALASGRSRLANASECDDTNRLANALNQLGVLARRSGDDMIVEGTGGRLSAPRFPIPAGNGGTVLRFLAAVAALAAGRTQFTADPRMTERPMTPLFGALRALGVEASQDEVLARYTIGGGGLRGGHLRVASDRSSQFLSALLLVSPYAKGDVTLEAEGETVSRPYLVATTAVMREFGVDVERPDERTFRVRSGRPYQPRRYVIEPDASGASPLFAAAAIAGGAVEVRGLLRVSVQGDAMFPDVLRAMGCTVGETAEGLRVACTGDLRGVDVDMNGMPDAVPALAVAALFASGPTRIRNVAHLRFKESDRLAALAEELRRCGGNVEVHDDGLIVIPAPLHGAEFDPRDDHRLAMSLALIGLRVPGVAVRRAECVSKSFPGFWDHFDRLR